VDPVKAQPNVAFGLPGGLCAGDPDGVIAVRGTHAKAINMRGEVLEKLMPRLTKNGGGFGGRPPGECV
jgi:hypothetical protein